MFNLSKCYVTLMDKPSVVITTSIPGGRIGDRCSNGYNCEQACVGTATFVVTEPVMSHSKSGPSKDAAISCHRGYRMLEQPSGYHIESCRLLAGVAVSGDSISTRADGRLFSAVQLGFGDRSVSN